METIEKALADDWTLIAHPDFTYSNDKSYVVMTSEDGMALKFLVNSNTLSIDSTSWDTKIEVRSQTLTITNDPTYEDED